MKRISPKPYKTYTHGKVPTKVAPNFPEKIGLLLMVLGSGFTASGFRVQGSGFIV